MWQQRGDSWCSLCLNHPSRSWTLSRLQKVGRGTPRTGRQSIEGPKQKDKQPRGLTSAEYLESQINITSLFLLFFFFDSSWSAFKNLLWSLCLFTSVEKGLRQRLMVLDQYVHVKQEVAFLPGSGVAQETERVISHSEVWWIDSPSDLVCMSKYLWARHAAGWMRLVRLVAKSKEYQSSLPLLMCLVTQKVGHTPSYRKMFLYLLILERHQYVTLKSVHPGWDLETANATDMTHVTLPCADGFAFVKPPFISSGFHFKSSPSCMADI